MTQGPWPLKPLVDVVEVLDSRRVPVKAADRAASGGDVPYYGATGQVGFIDRPLFNEPLLLLGEDGVPFLDPNRPKAYLIDGPAWVNNHAHVLRTSEQVDRRFLLYCLNTFDYRGFVNGTTRLKLTQTAMRSMTIPFPDMREQRRIVEIVEDHLSHLDAADAALALARQRASSMRHQLLFGSITGMGYEGPRTSEITAAECVDGRLPSIPEDWSWQRLGDVAEVVGGVTKDAKKQGDPAYVEVPYLRVANVQRGSLSLSNVSTIRVPAVKAEALRLQRGDLLLNEGGDRDKLARGWVWENQIPDCIHQNHVFRARLRGDLNPYFTAWATNLIGGPWAERNGKQSVNLASISLRMIKRLPVPVPPRVLADQTADKIRDELSDLERLYEAIAAAQSRRDALRRAVLAAAFSGRLTGASSDSEIIEEVAQG